MEKQTLLIILLIVTILVNAFLGIQVYYLIHQSSHPNAQTPLNVSDLQIVSQSSSSQNTTSSNNMQTSSMSTTVNNNSGQTYNYSLTVKFTLHIRDPGVYLVVINPKIYFYHLYVILYLEDGKVVSLNLDHTAQNITIDSKDVKVTLYIYAETNQQLSPKKLIEEIGLSFSFVSPSEDTENDFILVLPKISFDSQSYDGVIFF
ncbi:hypothetical protein [Sulfolobus acidocaldarius]|uniref:Conserved membrane protein n=4 Tax=Sulfolobus acidocaldarius TaxID=2285 RepID=Q4J6Q7_SULAC|nr:hypothetical protein [Sulfolobus acidocaldarius]AAY81524.1 conserved membrane protein [Sulfolobus acidocaldarius DSM 639]AGE72127.1 hypothetical protein SacN8_10905 [Sulfolobus acidocaldarius N8]AGE74444.1 hypothetical protein SacRon12I_11150 [Sulfolobus acidocaldarius Ron12/I]ALU29699.1 hypothetical protein ATY89_06915 [Sulfolobus acidocaldarius]ALU32434.1 hypothetical protein ATZ20_09935 [Sulfolobus acidocaldarius]